MTTGISYYSAGTGLNKAGLFARVPAEGLFRKVSGGCKNLVATCSLLLARANNL